MQFGSMFDDNANSSRDDNEVQRMRRQIIQNLNDAHQYTSPHDADPRQPDFTLDQNNQLITPDYQDSTDYYKLFWRLFLTNEIQLNELKKLQSNIQHLKQKVSTIDRLQKTYFHTLKQNNKKKHRRPAVEIDKSHSCPYPNCYKNYGSDVSLNLHIKIKHNGGNKTDREKLAQEVCLYEQGKGGKPDVNLCFPPGFLENFRLEFQKKSSNIAPKQL